LLFILTISPKAYGQYAVTTKPVNIWTKNICKGTRLTFTNEIDSTFDRDPFGNSVSVPVTKCRWWFPGVNNDTVIGKTASSILFDSVGDFEFVVEKYFRNPPVKYATWYPGNVIHVVDAVPHKDSSIQNINVYLLENATLNACGDGVKYRWFPSKGLDSDTALHVNVLQPFSDVIYSCTITDTNGCLSTCEYYVKVIDEPQTIYISNAFTPNGDGVNDIFKPITLNSEIRYMYIFNRFGELIFSIKQEDNVDFIWDGKNKNGIVEEGVYVVKIGWVKNRSKKGETYIGNVSLIR
jgi:gliding motility-associated-like protein